MPYRGPELTLKYLWELLTSGTSDGLLGVGGLIFAILSFLFLKRCLLGKSLKLSRLTLPSFFITAYILIVSLPSVIWFLTSTNAARYTYFVAVQSVPVLFLIGVRVANVLFRYPSRIITGFLSPSLSKDRHDSYIFPFYIFMIASSVVIITVYITMADLVPLLRSLAAYGETEGDLVRRSITRMPEVIQYAYALAVRFCLPFAVLYSYFMAHLYKREWKYTFWIIVCWTLFASLLTFERQHPLALFILLALAIYFKNNQAISKIHLVLFALAIFVGGIVSRTQYQHEINLAEIPKYATHFLVMRVWVDPSYMGSYYFEKYNDATTFLHGRSIRLLSFFGGEFEHITPPGFVADLWINFGWLGVIMGTISIGFLLQFIQLRFFRKKSILTLMVYILFLLNIVWLIYGSVLSTMVVSVYLLSALFLIALTITEGAVAVSRHNQRVWE